MKHVMNLAELLPQFDNLEFVLKTQRQLIKDFEKFNLTFEPQFQDKAFTKEAIVHRIAENIAELMKEGEQRLLQLLYTIDLPEKEFLVLISDPHFLTLLSEKILFREALKVFLRTKFSTP